MIVLLPPKAARIRRRRRRRIAVFGFIVWYTQRFKIMLIYD